jgi:chromosome segregation ATPase
MLPEEREAKEQLQVIISKLGHVDQHGEILQNIQFQIGQLHQNQQEILKNGEMEERRRMSEIFAKEAAFVKDDVEVKMQGKVAALEEDNQRLQQDNQRLRARLQSSEERLQSAEERLEKASIGSEEKSSIENQLSQMKIRNGTQQKQLDAKTAEISDLKRQLDAKMSETSDLKRQLTKASQDLSKALQDKHDLDMQLQAQQNDDLPQRLRECEAQLAESEQRNKRNQAQSEKVAKLTQYEKENKSIKQKMQDQHSRMRDLENQLRQAACQSRTPGEIWRMVESLEAKHHFSEENGRLHRLASELETERDLMRKENELFRRRLAPDVCASIKHEAAAAVHAMALKEEVCGQPFRELTPQFN